MVVANCAVNTSNIETDALDAEQAANARLIASSPDLLAALVGLLEWASAAADQIDNEWGASTEEPLRNGPQFLAARAALAKARGQ